MAVGRCTVSAAMIVRDEEAHLAACLDTIAGEVDEIVVLDTGSMDQTKAIARRYTSHVFEFAWQEDFAAARNAAIERASCDWILYIDADERLSVPRAGALSDCVQRPEAVALSVRFRPRPNYTPYREVRLFRRDPRIRFEGVIHESPRRSIEKVAASDGRVVGEADVGLVHLGYEGDLTRKYRRNLPLLQTAVKTAPERAFLWTDLAEALAGLGRDEEARQACRRAIETASAHAHDQKQTADAVQAWRRLIALSGEDAKLELARRAIALHPASHSLRFDLAGALFAAGASAEALPIVRTLTQIDAEAFVDPTTAYDKRIFGEWAFDLMGAIHLRLGDRAAAAAAFGEASRRAPANPAYWLKARAIASGVD